MKKVLFVTNGKVDPEHKKFAVAQRKEGHTVNYANGSHPKGFEMTCDAVILDCDNENISKWAKEENIKIEYYGDKKAPVVNETVVNELVIETKTEAEQKAELPIPEMNQVQETEGLIFDVPDAKTVPKGAYFDPDSGDQIDRKQGGFLNAKLVEIITKHGWAKIKETYQDIEPLPAPKKTPAKRKTTPKRKPAAKK